MILNMSGGGESHNFAVVGGTSVPASPKANTVWVETATAISSWIFSPVEPNDPQEGMVWLKTGSKSPVAFNALKKNGIMLYPTECMQYIGNEWVGKNAKSYLDGEWVDWGYGTIYSYGDEYEHFTGGLVIDRGTNGEVTKMGDHIAFTGKKDTNTDYMHGVCYTTKPIDLTNFTTLKAIVHTEKLQYTAGTVKVGAVSDIEKFNPTQARFEAFPGGESTETGDLVVTYDVSGLSGEYYVGFWNRMNVTKLYELILE